ERASGDQRRRRFGIRDAVQRLGNRVACAEATNSVDARECRKRVANSRSSRTHDAVFEYRLTDSVLALVPDAVFHGCRGAFSVSRRIASLTGNTPAQTCTIFLRTAACNFQ